MQGIKTVDTMTSNFGLSLGKGNIHECDLQVICECYYIQQDKY